MKVSAIAVLAGLLISAMVSTANAYELSVTVTLEGSTEPVANAVVSVDSARPATPVSAEIYQKDRAFHPHVLVVPVGSSVDFPLIFN